MIFIRKCFWVHGIFYIEKHLTRPFGSIGVALPVTPANDRWDLLPLANDSFNWGGGVLSSDRSPDIGVLNFREHLIVRCFDFFIFFASNNFFGTVGWRSNGHPSKPRRRTDFSANSPLPPLPSPPTPVKLLPCIHLKCRRSLPLAVSSPCLR